MTLDPDAFAVVKQIRVAGLFARDFDPAGFRPVFEVMAPQMWDASGIELASVQDLHFPGADGARLPLRLYTPRSAQTPLPILVFFHGGGFTSGSVNTADPHCRYLAHHAEIMVASADYRLAPEHKHPAGFEDCVKAVEWVAARCDAFGADPARLAVGGDAPGATYAASAALHFRDRGEPVIAFQFLLSPATDFVGFYSDKISNFAIGPVSGAAVENIEAALFSSASQRSDWRISPLHATRHSGLPPAFIMCGEYDFLRPEIDAYVKQLRAADVPVTYQCWPGGMHNFFSMFDQIELARVAMRNAAHNLRLALHGGAAY
jgi:acetyl esterase